MIQVAMLRGINLGPARRVPMAELRALLGDAGYGDVRTYVQSGNAVLAADTAPAATERAVGKLISERFGFDVAVVVRTADELAAVVALNPLKDVVTEPKRYQVTFLAAPLEAERVQALQAAASDSERVVAHGREIYAWHPDGVARSQLATALAGKGLKIAATARNWTTVSALLELARAAPGDAPA